MKRFVLALMLALGMVVIAALPAVAATDPMPTPGPDFGPCVSGMANTGAMAGAAFGQCVSAMAHGICSCAAGMMS